MSILSNINQVVIAGRLGRDPEEFGNGKVSSFSIANNKNYKDPKKGGEWSTSTSWINVKAFGRQVEELRRYHKGDLVIIHGALKEESWETQGGRSASKLVVVMDGISRLERPPAPNEEPEQQELEGFPDEVPDDSDVPF